jgi:hypothetical protein
MRRNGYFELLPREIVREILTKIPTLGGVASFRRVSKLFYDTSTMYGNDIFSILYKKELGCMIRSESISCHMFQGFYFNFFPAIRHAIRNGIRITHRHIDIENDLHDRMLNKKFSEGRLELWRRILKHLPVKKSFIKHTINKWYKSILKFNATEDDASHNVEHEIERGADGVFADFYLDLLEMLISFQEPRKTNKKYFLKCMKKMESVKMRESTQPKIDRFKSVVDRFL